MVAPSPGNVTSAAVIAGSSGLTENLLRAGGGVGAAWATGVEEALVLVGGAIVGATVGFDAGGAVGTDVGAAVGVAAAGAQPRPSSTVAVAATPPVIASTRWTISRRVINPS